jgi:hypothetical protein
MPRFTDYSFHSLFQTKIMYAFLIPSTYVTRETEFHLPPPLHPSEPNVNVESLNDMTRYMNATSER